MKIERFMAFAAVCAIVVSLCSSMLPKKVKPTLIKDNLAYVIVIDAGHGGIDGGVTGVNTKVKESEINLKIAFLLKELLEENGFTAILTRKDDNGLYGTTDKGFKRRDMQARRDIILASGADLVVSIHQNSYKAAYRSGAQIFYQKGSQSGEAFARAMQKVFNLRGNIKNEYLSGDFYICRCSDIPSVIVECGFLSNPSDEAKLLTDEYRRQIARYIMEGCVAYLFGVSQG